MSGRKKEGKRKRAKGTPVGKSGVPFACAWSGWASGREEVWGRPEGVRGAEKGNDARGKGWVCGRIGKLWGRRRYEQ